MKQRLFGGACAAVFALAAGGMQPAVAQESTNRVAANTDWSVFVETQPSQECWGVSVPKESTASRDGQSVSVRRGQILLFITYRPGQAGEISFAGGYPFAPGSQVQIAVGDASFDLFTEGETAWAGSPEEDARIIAAMKGGANAIVTGRSARGNITRDDFSLMGFTAATDEAARRCAG